MCPLSILCDDYLQMSHFITGERMQSVLCVVVHNLTLSLGGSESTCDPLC